MSGSQSWMVLGGEWRNRILLCRVDVDQPEEALQQAQIWDHWDHWDHERFTESLAGPSEGDHCSLPRQAVTASCVDRCGGTDCTTVVELLWNGASEYRSYRSLRSFFCCFLNFGHQVPFSISDFKTKAVDAAFFRKAAAYLETLHKYQSKGAEAQLVVRKWAGEVTRAFPWKTAWTLGEKNNHYYLYHGIWMNMKHMYCMHLHQEHVQTAAESGIPAGWRLWEGVWPRETIMLDCWRC